jgi:hypothetical protein
MVRWSIAMRKKQELLVHDIDKHLRHFGGKGLTVFRTRVECQAFIDQTWTPGSRLVEPVRIEIWVRPWGETKKGKAKK